ncbi:alpha/beta hydrolase [Tunturibacter empetritectus]|uniref:Acetyl esterase/lipase n=1 Tax=Tunturiibacter lichenicola TaxID=2051959 RepID=A0A7W8JBT5_9BACT|nr:alpha/beta hydrolase [Edaphobacter lichenicola]MBB5345057.1 acetyl esterase/lipase [Edaphobacter lichenicola]
MSNLSMDPAFAPLAKQPRVALRDPNVVREALSAARLGARPLPDSDIEIKDYDVRSTDEEGVQIPVRIYRRRNAVGSLPVLLYFHGGGFFCGDLFSEEPQCIHYALNAQCAVVCVAYRLAPEEPFPAALNDCYRTLEFLWRESRDLNLDRDFIAVGGSSAGANLAAAVALLARDRMGPKICFQMLLIPAVDDRLETLSARQFTDVPDFGRSEAEVMWRWYLGEQAHDISPYAAPARATDLSDLPASYVLCAGLDPLRDEGLDYARRLTEAGVAVELHLVPSIPHGFASIPSAAISKRLLKEQVEVLRGAFSRKSEQL